MLSKIKLCNAIEWNEDHNSNVISFICEVRSFSPYPCITVCETCIFFFFLNWVLQVKPREKTLIYLLRHLKFEFVINISTIYLFIFDLIVVLYRYTTLMQRKKKRTKNKICTVFIFWLNFFNLNFLHNVVIVYRFIHK